MNPILLRRGWAIAFAFLLAVTFELQAQPTTTGGRQPGVNRTTGGNRTATGGGARGGGTGSGSRQYSPSGTVGEALISADPETRRIIVITDDETSQYVSQVITNLDRPKPQVLIKVVFMEVS